MKQQTWIGVLAWLLLAFAALPANATTDGACYQVRLRNQTFFSLAELNDRIARHLGTSQRQLFEQLDKPALKRLPAEAYT